VRLILAALLICVLPGCRPASHSVPQAITGAMLIDGTARPPIANAVVLIERGRIRAMGPVGEVRIPKEYNRIDARDRFLFPALIAEPLRVGGDANLLVLTVNPALDPDYLKKVTGQMEDGRWVQYPQ
jgi:hypothetical protein